MGTAACEFRSKLISAIIELYGNDTEQIRKCSKAKSQSVGETGRKISTFAFSTQPSSKKECEI